MTFRVSWRLLLALPNFRILAALLKLGHMPVWIALLDDAHLCELFPSGSVASLPVGFLSAKTMNAKPLDIPLKDGNRDKATNSPVGCQPGS